MRSVSVSRALFALVALAALAAAHPALAAPAPRKSGVALLVVGRLKDPAMRKREEQVIVLLQRARKQAGLSAQALPILTYHFDDAKQRKYCEGRLGIRASQLVFAGVVRLARDRLPSEVVEGRPRVSNAQAAARELFGLATARVQPKESTAGATPQQIYAMKTARGDALLDQGDAQGALLEYNAATAAASAEWRGHLRRSTALIALRRAPEAEAAAQQAITLAPQEALAHGLLGLAQAAQGKDPVPQLRKAEQLSPEWAVPHAWLAQYALGRRDWDLARAEALAADKLDAKLAAPQYVLGTIDVQQWRIPEAIKRLEEAVKRQPDWAPPYSTLGWSQILLGEYDKAWETYNVMVDLAPLSAEPLVGKALAAYYNGDASLALQVLEQARALEPEDATTRAIAAFAHASLGQAAKAMTAAQAAMTLNPRNPNAVEALGDAQAAAGDSAAAITSYERADAMLQGWPEPELYYKWALVCEKAGQRAQAIGVATRLARQYPGSPYAAKARTLLQQWNAPL